MSDHTAGKQVVSIDHLHAGRYARDINLEDLNNAHSIAILSVPPGSSVLDIGVADGSVARALRQRGCTVWGVDIDASAARVAERFCERVIVHDVETLDFEAAFEGLTFDVVLALDVLEHLRDPAELLRRVKPCIAPSGRVLASIPNIAHAAVKLNLMKGKFTYTETGLLDRTHIMFFDRTAVEEMLGLAGYITSDTLRVTRGFDETEIHVDAADFAPEVVATALADPEATTYQFIVQAVPSASRADASGESLAGALQSRLGDMEGLMRARVSELEEVIRERMDDLAAVHVEFKHVQMDVLVKDGHIARLRESLALAESAKAEAEQALSIASSAQLAAQADAQTMRDELERLRVLEIRVANSAGYRAVDRTYNAIRRIPGVYAISRAMVRLLGRRQKR